jgi:hypothetical protein
MDKINVFAPGISLPPILFKDKVVILNMSNNIQSDLSLAADAKVINQYPLTLMCDSLPDFKFPIDPIISLSFRNIITRRTVAKSNKRGTVKERWTEDDVEISIYGAFSSQDGAYPREVEALRKYFEYRGQIDVRCSLINQHDIFSIVIESFDLPHTKGLENQAFIIKAFSDDVYNLLIKQ